MKFLPLCSIVALLVLGGCATHIHAPSAPNMPSTKRFSEYPAVYMFPLQVEKWGRDNGDRMAVTRIQDTLIACMSHIFPKLQQGHPEEGSAALVIVPTILNLKKVNSSERFFLGPLAGSSAILLEVTYTDNKTKLQIATATSYSKADAWGGTMTVGATDNLMLQRVTNNACDYASAND